MRPGSEYVFDVWEHREDGSKVQYRVVGVPNAKGEFSYIVDGRLGRKIDERTLKIRTKDGRVLMLRTEDGCTIPGP